MFVVVILFLMSAKVAWAKVDASEIVSLTNNIRVENHLPPLVLNPKLVEAAVNKANDIIKNNYWAHVSPTGVTPWNWINNTGYRYLSAGENLARGYGNSQNVMLAWLDSPTHKRNLLSAKFCQIGVAVEDNIVVQMMACPRKTNL